MGGLAVTWHRCVELKGLSVKLRQRRLRWFGHVKRAGGGCVG